MEWALIITFVAAGASAMTAYSSNLVSGAADEGKGLKGGIITRIQNEAFDSAEAATSGNQAPETGQTADYQGNSNTNKVITATPAGGSLFSFEEENKWGTETSFSNDK